MTEDEFEPAVRELCPDGSCIGLVGPDGRCKVCGTVAPSAVADPRYRGMSAPRPVGDAGDEEASELGELDTDRELCPDDACVGVIGPDGRCKVCGTRADGDRVDAEPGAAGDSAERAGGASPQSGAEFDPDEDRELCPDGSCVGLIGPDGRCKVCGTARSSSTS